MSYGEVQGPINKEPEEKLDPGSKPASSGIRRLYVLNDYNNTLNVELIVIYNVDCYLLPKKITLPNTTTAISIESSNDSISTNQISKSNTFSIGKCSADNSLNFGLLILMLNIYYLLFCVYMNKFLVSFINYSIKFFNYDLILAIVLLRVYKNIKSKKKISLFSFIVDNCLSNRSFKHKITTHKLIFYLCVFVFCFLFLFQV